MYSCIINLPIYLFNLLFITIQREGKKNKKQVLNVPGDRLSMRRESLSCSLTYFILSISYTLIIGTLGTGSHKMHHDSPWEGTAQKKEDKKSKSYVRVPILPVSSFYYTSLARHLNSSRVWDS